MLRIQHRLDNRLTDVLCFLWGTNWICMLCGRGWAASMVWRSEFLAAERRCVVFPVRYELGLCAMRRRVLYSTSSFKTAVLCTEINLGKQQSTISNGLPWLLVSLVPSGSETAQQQNTECIRKLLYLKHSNTQHRTSPRYVKGFMGYMEIPIYVILLSCLWNRRIWLESNLPANFMGSCCIWIFTEVSPIHEFTHSLCENIPFVTFSYLCM
jgi:hypothetical protein